MLHMFSIQVSASKMLTHQSEVAEWIRKSKLFSITADKPLDVANVAVRKSLQQAEGPQRLAAAWWRDHGRAVLRSLQEAEGPQRLAAA
jgi:hypothetical protein